MTKEKQLWGYAKTIFSLPNLDLEGVANIIGRVNVAELLATARKRLTSIDRSLREIQKQVKAIKDFPGSDLVKQEIIASGAGLKLAQDNLTQLITFLKKLKASTKNRGVVLPQFRSVTHFKVGDEIMIFVGKKHLAEHDWISAKMLKPGWDWVMHCHSNKQWTPNGSNGGHYFRTTNQYDLFKRSDFFRLLKMLRDDPSNPLLRLLPTAIAKRVHKGSVDPVTDQEIKEQREVVIKKAVKIVYFYEQNILALAKRYGVKLDS